MARVTHVKKAQQRYETVIVRNEDGTPKQTPVMRSVKDRETGEVTQVQKVTKKGKPVFMTVTVADKEKPKPLLRCDFSGCQINDGRIAIGTSYKHITPKSGPYGGTQKNRHAEHPTWNVWEYSQSLSARIAQIQHGADFSTCESVEDFEGVMESLTEEAKSLAEEKQESATNIEDGFGHETSVSAELTEVAEALEEWAENMEGVDFPEYPEPEAETCDECGGTGMVDNPDYDPDDEESDAPDEITCDECSGEGEVIPDDPTEEQIEEWISECTDAAQEAVDDVNV